MRNPPLRVGIISNEFFDHAVGRMGGFGWVAAFAARALAATGAFHVEFLSGERAPGDATDEAVSHGLPLHFSPRSSDARALAVGRFDVLLSIDYRPSYYPILDRFGRTPLIVWVNDPRPRSDCDKIDTLRIPGRESEAPQGIGTIDCRGLALWHTWRRRLARRMIFAAPEPALSGKFAGTYGFAPPRTLRFLPYALDLELPLAEKTRKASVVYLGRLDPVKRPWVFTEAARLLPDVDFFLVGKAHFEPPGAWVPHDLPPNVTWTGHVDGAVKSRLVSAAWALVNTSIHEALPVSFVESLAGRTPLVSCQDPGGLVSRFGTFVGRFDGSGLQAVPAFADAIRALTLERVMEVGTRGRDWALAHHSRARFLTEFVACCRELRIRMPAVGAARH